MKPKQVNPRPPSEFRLCLGCGAWGTPPPAPRCAHGEFVDLENAPAAELEIIEASAESLARKLNLHDLELRDVATRARRLASEGSAEIRQTIARPVVGVIRLAPYLAREHEPDDESTSDAPPPAPRPRPNLRIVETPVVSTIECDAEPPEPTIDTIVEPDTLLRLLTDVGLRVRKYEVRPILKKSTGEERPMLFVQIAARWRANAFGGAGSPGFYGDRPRWQLTTYLEHVPAIVRALAFFAERDGLYGLLCELNARRMTAVEKSGPLGGRQLWFPRSDIAELFMGFRRDDIAEAIFVLLSYDDPCKGVEAVRRLR